MDFDLVIVGAGPAGLCLARALRSSGLRLALVEQQDRSALAGPAFDGREIALTHHSGRLLRELDIWPRIDSRHIAPLKDALVLDGSVGPGQARLRIGHEHGHASELGHLVSNHHIRRAAFDAALAPDDRSGPAPELRCAVSVRQIRPTVHGVHLVLADGAELQTRLLVAADSRHSTTRRAMGIGADLHDHGRSMLVCRMTHAQPHHQTAWEWFDHGQTLALLPMNPCPQTGLPRSSVVLTLPHHELQPLLDLPEAAFGEAMARRFGQQLGRMRLDSSRHAYPLVGVWAQRFVAPRFAVVGDAAVGMHPVTAHGFNLGLRSIHTLAGLLAQARQRGLDIAAPALLARYEQTHRRASRGLYLATHALATLYTREQPPARWLRQALVGLGERLPPFKHAVAASLTGLH